MMTSPNENKDGLMSLLASVLVDLGFPVIYSNLVYWAKVYNIPLDDVDKALRTLKEEGLLEIKYVFRCPKCGSPLGEYKHIHDVPEILVCPNSHEISKKELVSIIQDPDEADRIVTILWYPTDKGKRFFRTFQKRKEKILQRRIVETISKSSFC